MTQKGINTSQSEEELGGSCKESSESITTCTRPSSIQSLFPPFVYTTGMHLEDDYCLTNKKHGSISLVSFIETFWNAFGSHFAAEPPNMLLKAFTWYHRSVIHLRTSRVTLAACRLKSFDPVLLTRCICPTCCTLHCDFTFAAHKSCIKPLCHSCGPSRETIKRLLNCSDLFRERYLLRIKWPHWLT